MQSKDMSINVNKKLKNIWQSFWIIYKEEVLFIELLR